MVINPDALAAVLDRDSRWQAGSLIKVWFIDGDQQDHQLVKTTAREWTRYANIEFQFFSNQPDSSHLRISFAHYDGSMLGRQPLSKDRNPNVYLASITHPSIELTKKKRIVLHEFGHILGFEHEFLHPEWPFGNAWLEHQQENCKFRLESQNTNGKPELCEQLNMPLTKASIVAFPFDRLSIMQYPVPAKWLDGSFEPIPDNRQLSSLDKMAAAISYPETQPANKGFRFINRCLEPVTVSYDIANDVSRSGIGAQIKRITLKPMESSHWYQTNISVDLSLRAVSHSGSYHWRSDSEPNRYLTVPKTSWSSGTLEIPLFCSY
ncbi:MAG: hypothetical protein HWE27_09915 [Gammaproteobacteria bacterium]|nr:hypothetical protein [Gammaproteobacteria bacterium]